MTAAKIIVKKFPEMISEMELNADFYDFYHESRYAGWLTKENILNSPLVMVLRVRYYEVDSKFLEMPSRDHIPECEHENFGWIWDNEQLAWDCCQCRILIHDPYMREIHNQNYEPWRRHQTS